MIRQNRDLRPSQRSGQNPKLAPPTATENGTSLHVQRYRRFLQLDIGRQPVGRVGGLLWKSVCLDIATAFRFLGGGLERWAVVTMRVKRLPYVAAGNRPAGGTLLSRRGHRFAWASVRSPVARPKGHALLPGVGMPKLPKPLVRCDQGFLLTPLSVDGPRDSQNRLHDLQEPLRHLEILPVAEHFVPVNHVRFILPSRGLPILYRHLVPEKSRKFGVNLRSSAPQKRF